MARQRTLAQFLVYLWECRENGVTKFYLFNQGLFMNEAEYLDQEDQEKAVEIRIEDVIYRSDESPAVVLTIKRTCSLSGECKIGHVTLGQENTLRLYLET
jgi:hypothetical protein